jgi:hypothetical protein
MQRPEGRFFIRRIPGAVMQRRQQILSIAAKLALWAAAAQATPPPERDELLAEAPAETGPAPTWAVVDARNHLTGARGPVAVAFGIVQERGRSRPASLRIDSLDGTTTVRIDAAGLKLGPFAVAVRYSLDGGRFVAASWPAAADQDGLELGGDHAIQFATELYGKVELRLAVVRPLSVPLLFTFVVDGAEAALRPLAEHGHWSEGPAISDLQAPLPR